MDETAMQYVGQSGVGQMLKTERDSLQTLHKRLQEQLNLICDMENQVMDIANSTFGSLPLNSDKATLPDVPDATLSNVVSSIERATSRLRSQINRF